VVVSWPRCTMHKATKSAQAKLQMEGSRGATHKVLKSAQVNTQTEQPRRTTPKVHKSVLVEPQMPRVAECPTEVGRGGWGQVFPVRTIAASKTWCGTLVSHLTRVVCATCPGTMVLRVGTHDIVRPGHRDMCTVVGTEASVGANSVQPDTVVEMARLCLRSRPVW